MKERPNLNKLDPRALAAARRPQRAGRCHTEHLQRKANSE